MVYKNSINGLEYRASICYVSHSLTQTKQIVYTSNGEYEETITPYFCISFIGNNFELDGKKYYYTCYEEYLKQIEQATKDMEALGFYVSEKKPSIAYPLLNVVFIHKETKEAIDRVEKEMKERIKNGEHGYVRYGNIPESGKSYNYRDGFYEIGVSVYRAVFFNDRSYTILHTTPFELFGTFAYSGRPLYRVWGEEVGTGSDGEPVLKVIKAIRLDEKQAR